MLHFKRSANRWWQKPLVDIKGRGLPAELVVLEFELRPGEAGAWLNSRGVSSGTVDLTMDKSGSLKTVRIRLPKFVAEKLRQLYATSRLSKGAPDLVLWNGRTHAVRFVEVKCPDWDRPSPEQFQFHRIAEAAGCRVDIVVEIHPFRRLGAHD